MEYTNEQIEEMANKTKKWDALGEKIAKCYGDYDDEGNELPSEYEEEFGSEPDLCTIGEMAASAYGWL